MAQPPKPHRIRASVYRSRDTTLLAGAGNNRRSVAGLRRPPVTTREQHWRPCAASTADQRVSCRRARWRLTLLDAVVTGPIHLRYQKRPSGNRTLGHVPALGDHTRADLL